MPRDEPPAVSTLVSATASPSKSKLLCLGAPVAGGAEKRRRLGGAAEQLERREQLARRRGLGGAAKGGHDPLDPSSYSDAPRCDALAVVACA